MILAIVDRHRSARPADVSNLALAHGAAAVPAPVHHGKICRSAPTRWDATSWPASSMAPASRCWSASISTLAALAIGIPLGAAAGYFGNRIDDALMRFTEFFQTVPSFALAIVLVAILQPSIVSIVIAIAIVSWPPVARLVRGEVLSLRSREYVQAAIVTGQSNSWIIWREIMPNALSPVIVLASLMVATAILLESSLSFLGLGDPNLMSWGYMVGAGRTVIRQAWWITVFPGIAILVSVLALNLIGEGLNDALNPRLAKEGR